MNTENFKRRLTAILSADVEGYSRLMRDDEDETIRTITVYRTAIARLVEQYRGRVVDSPGDNILSEFGSSVDAVNCAVEVQRELAERNAELSENRRMQFRIGVNSGDVVEEGERIYGDGVNIASRIEGLAEGGGICISGTVYDSIEGKLGLEFENLGKHEVKNIDKPIRVYRVLSYPGAAAHRVRKVKSAFKKTWRKTALAIAAVLVIVVGAWAVWQFELRPTVPSVEPASVEKMVYPLPDKPSIAVLPFENLSHDPAQENIVDGITDAIITGLSKTPEMFVIARNSAFTYKGKPVKVKQVSEDLGVRYVLEGSVQKQGDKLRINAQLIDAVKGHHLWAQKYDRDLKDLFALQDEITMKVLTELQVKLTDGEYARSVAKGTNNIEAYLKCLQAITIFRRHTKDDVLLARKIFEESNALDPNYPTPYIYLGFNYRKAVERGWSESPKEDLARAEEFARKAIELDDSLGIPHRLLAHIYWMKKQWDKALEEAERGVSIEPNNPLTVYGLAYLLLLSGRPEEAIAMMRKAFRLDPFPPAMYIFVSGNCYFNAHRYEEALAEYRRALRKGGFSPKILHMDLAATYAMLGQEDKARYHVAEVLKIDPKASIKRRAKIFRSLYKNQADVDRRINALRKAGLPENPPGTVPEKPSIAVLPFANISGDPKEDYLSDGITEQIITALSKIPQMLVIARNSVFTYKGKPTKVQDVSKELGVRYVLEGSVQKEGDRLRITAQLIDAKTGNHLWSERYDRDLKDLFDLQDDITKNVITALQIKLTRGETARLLSKGTKNLDAYLKVVNGLHHLSRINKNDNEISRPLFEEAIALDHNYAYAFVSLAWTYYHEAREGWTKTPAKSYEKAVELAKKAIFLDEQNPRAYMVLACVYSRMGQFEKAMAAGKKGLSLNPASPIIKAVYGHVLSNMGRFNKTILLLKKAIRIDPKHPNWYLLDLGWAYFWTGQSGEAIATFRKYVSREPQNALAYASLGCALNATGKPEEAVEMFEKALNLNPRPPSWYIGDLAIARLGTGKSEEAITTMQELVSRRPDDRHAYRKLSWVLIFGGRHEEALSMAKKATTLKPAPKPSFYEILGFSYLVMGQYGEAIAAFRKAIDLWPDFVSSHIGLTASISLAGRMEEARAQAAEVLRINPKTTLEGIGKYGWYNFQKADKQRFINALRKAGLK
ncbi:MAG: tetratricopeptide repeat protein [Deltaproteobacteria bacterium]|uniref:Tetratricopeptide repeat protein n=1 Tax=Candidatus Desulfacyla euxinica TaxID=2841693 RepID=A0A8J6MVQ8_9DELT|nr:tetratricopeptide repeat protein [Candidatus Desulfacyla euxinica]MBL7216585.1 tetratricopeptide repeat protein [Desulfobacteraceae bacterium]